MLKQSRQSMRRRVMAAFLTFAVLQSVVFFILLITTNIFEGIYKQAFSTYSFEVVRNSKLIQESFNRSRSGFVPVATQLNQAINASLPNGNETLAGYTEAQAESVLTLATDYIIGYLNASQDVSGVFVILDRGETKKDCVYICDNSEVSGIRSDESKIYMIGPASIAKNNRFQLHYLWKYHLDFANFETPEAMDFYYKPMLAAKENVPYSDLFYWGRPIVVIPKEPPAVTMTLPLIDDEGVPYGVCGFEISSNFLKRNMPYSQLGGVRSFYMLGDPVLMNNIGRSIVNGAYFDQLFLETPTQSDESKEFNITRVNSPRKEIPPFFCATADMQLYNKNSPFASELWALHGLSPASVVTQYPFNILRSIIVVQIIVFAISIIVCYITSIQVTKPIELLSKRVREVGTDETIALPRTGISEMDELTDALEYFGKEIVISSSRLSTIADMTGVSIGGYERRRSDDMVYLTESLIKMFGLDLQQRKVDTKTFWELYKGLGLEKYQNYENVYVIEKEQRWFRVKNVESDFAISGLVMDVTQEILDYERVEYERDHDGMTKLLNRKAFLQEVENIIAKNQYELGALLFLDMDNLKYINDTYGHDYGDRYICAMADALLEFDDPDCVLSRMSGDEFTVYIPSNKDKGYVRDKIYSVIGKAKKTVLELPDQSFQSLRFSTGFAWYPFDSGDLELLVKYADFAMYETKHNIKGSIGEFSARQYQSKSFLHNRIAMLNKIIEEELLEYVYQPIVDAVTGEIFAYEMLMRCPIDGLRSPAEIIPLAKSQSKLYFLEMICLKKLAEVLVNRPEEIGDRLIFFNSFSSVAIDDGDIDVLLKICPDIFSRSIIEITESDEFTGDVYNIKTEQIKRNDCRVALDDYGSGYNGQSLLLRLNPDFVKIDMALVREIHRDKNKQQLVSTLVRYCIDHGIKTIAEGVEILDELKTLKGFGVDYFQGFYFGYPSPNFAPIAAVKRDEIINVKDAAIKHEQGEPNGL